MALTGSLTLQGMTITNAYIQVRRIFGGPKDGGYQCLLRIYANQATRLANEDNYLAEKNASAPAPYMAGQDAFTTVYAALSATGGDYAGFTNC